MIWMARQNGGSPINLFQKHDANHLMRPGRGAECNPDLCLAPQIGRKSVRAADQENCVGNRFVPPAAKMTGESRAVEVVAALIQRHQHGFFGDRSRYRRGFLSDAGGGIAGAALGNFMDLQAAKTELAADILEAFAVALGELPFRTLLQPADRYHH